MICSHQTFLTYPFYLKTARICGSSLALLTLLFISTSGCTQAQNKTEIRPISEVHTSKKVTASPNKVKKEEKKKKEEIFRDFKGIDYSGLNKEQQASFLKIVNAEPCPCSCAKTWAACIQTTEECHSGKILANWLIERLADDVPSDLLTELIGNEITAFTAPKKTPKTDGFTLKGNPKAPIQIVEFADFQCGHCAAAVPVINALVKKYPKDLGVTFKHFPFDSHPWSKIAAEAVEAAGLQGKFWQMQELIFKTQTSLNEETIQGHARLLELNMKKWQADRRSKIILDRVTSSRMEAQQLGIQATPTFYINGRTFELFRDFESFEMRFAMEKARAQSTCK